MSGQIAAALFGLQVPNGDVMIPVEREIPTGFRITMAAIDPSAEPEFSGTAIDGTTPRATLKIIRQPIELDDEDDSDYDSEEEERLKALIDGVDSEEDSSDEEANGGPSDPSKSKKARRDAAVEALKKALADGQSDDDMEDAEVNGISTKSKGKAPATGDEDSSSEGDSEGLELEEFVICTLDCTSHFQQPLDISVAADEQVFFKVSGTHSVYLTGNYIIPVDDRTRRGSAYDEEDMYDEDDEDDEDDYDLTPDEDELRLGLDEDEESDELDDMEDPRIRELASDEEEEIPQLVKKGKNKRAAPGSDDGVPGLDELMDKAAGEEVKLSKKQQKKLKNNEGKAVKSEVKVETESPGGKKVQFAKNLEQGPTGKKVETTTVKVNGEKPSQKANDKAVASSGGGLGVKEVKGVTIDVKKEGSGKAAKKGNKISMRYIGKLKDGKQFDANKKGEPFKFKLGAGEVIQGWDIGVEGIMVGGERRLTIPPHLAYGKKSMPGIPANSQLIFDIKCLAIN